MAQKLDTRAFIEKARAVHGERYDYSQVEYVNNNRVVTILCAIHGLFNQRPRNHISCQGCPACKKGVATSKEFIAKARAVHGDRYDYSQVEYARTSTKVEIICPAHNSFWQKPNGHLSGKGCPECSPVKPLITETFVAKARAVHGDRYDYSQVEYNGCLDLVTITCRVHGTFQQRPRNHLTSRGCPHCGMLARFDFSRASWLAAQNNRKAQLYLIELNDINECFYKIGITFNLTKRFQGTNKPPYSWRTIAIFKSNDAGKVYDLEQQIHKELEGLRYKPALSFGGETECYLSIQHILPMLPDGTFFLKNRVVK